MADGTISRDEAMKALLHRLYLVSCKLDLAVEHYGDLAHLCAEDAGVALIVKEVAADLDSLYCALGAANDGQTDDMAEYIERWGLREYIELERSAPKAAEEATHGD